MTTARVRGWGVLLLMVLAASGAWGEIHPEVRLKDLADVEGVRGNQLVGMGLVVGLAGTGDKGTLVNQMMQNMAQQFGIAADAKSIKSKNAAVVTVTCNLPPFVRPGQTVDVEVSTMGDAKSLQGGILLQTPLKGANGQVYAVAQGPLLVGGYAASGQGAQVSKNSTTVGRVPGGGIVEREVVTEFAPAGVLSYLLRNPDFTTAQRLAQVLNEKFGRVAVPVDAGRVEVRLPAQYAANPSAFLAEVEGLRIRPDVAARVVVNERSGTVVMGGDVRISSVAVASGNLTVRVQETPQVSQPNPFGQGSTVATTETSVAAQEQSKQMVSLPASSSVQDLVDALNAVGATPRDIITILQAISQAGALHGELVIE